MQTVVPVQIHEIFAEATQTDKASMMCLHHISLTM